METPNSSVRQKARLHPLVATAAIALIVLSAVGVTTLVMSRSDATPASPYAAPAAPAALPASAASLPSAPVEQSAPAPQVVAPQPPAPTPAPRLASNAPAQPNYGTPATTQPSTPVYEEPRPVARAAAVCRECGVVDSIRDIKVKGEGTGVGAVGGAVVGGLLGNMVGAGRGKALATVAGAVGGGLGGNAIEKNVRSSVEHQMVVRLDNGSTRTFTQAAPFSYGVGERVRIVNGRVQRG